MSRGFPSLRAFLFVGIFTLSLVPANVDAGHLPIQPGSQVSTSIGTSNASCTLNFVFDGEGNLNGRTFIGTAAHCVAHVGDKVHIDGHRNIGTVFYVGDIPNAVNSDGRPDNGHPGHQLDFALIDVTGAASVSGEVRGHPGMPTASTISSETFTGHFVMLSGHGMVVSMTKDTREKRQGMLWTDDARMFNAYAPGTPGDSGGPVLHQSGKAIGVASTMGTNGLAGPTVEGVLAELADLGIPVSLRTV